jgi:fructose-1,6-bisphosphatase/inositol monophosphatase family enzyme
VSLAYVQGGVTRIWMIFDPPLNRMFTAWKGRGA